MSLETDSPDHGGRNPYPGPSSPTDAPPSVVGTNGDHAEADGAATTTATSPEPTEVNGSPSGSGTNGNGAPALDHGDVIAPPGPQPGPDATAPFIDLRVDGLGQPSSDPEAGLPALPPSSRRGPRRGRHQAVLGGAPTEGRWVVHRLRNVSPWSVFKIVVLFYFCVFLMFMVAGVLLWKIGRSTETVDQVEGLVTRLGAYGECVPRANLAPGDKFETDDDCPDGEVIIDGFAFNDGTLFKSALFVIAGTTMTVLLTVLLNLLNDVTGGLRYATVREPVPPPSRSTGR